MKELIISVDDDFITNMYNQMVLNEANIAKVIQTLSSGQAVLDYFECEENPIPEVLLLDLNMPIVNGWEVLDRLLAQPLRNLESMKIFLLTSSPIVDDIERSKKHPLVSGVLLKPLQVEKLKSQF